MNRLVKHISNNLMLKGIACILGVICWLKYSQHVPVEYYHEIPIFFYNLEEELSIHAPESIQALLKGYRPQPYVLNSETCAVHLDAKQLKKGVNTITITSGNISLPDTLSMIHYSPSSVTVYIE